MLMIVGGEVSSDYSFGLFEVRYAVEMAFEPFFDRVFRLANIEFLASGAFYAINEIIAVACDVFHRSVFLASCVTE